MHSKFILWKVMSDCPRQEPKVHEIMHAHACNSSTGSQPFMVIPGYPQRTSLRHLPEAHSLQTYLLPNTSSKLRRKPLLYGQGCIRSFSYISIVVQFAASMLLCMMRKPAKLTANALLMTTAMKHTAPL